MQHEPNPHSIPIKILLPHLVGSFVDPSVWLFLISQSRYKTHLKTKITLPKTKSKFTLVTSFKEADNSSTGSLESAKLVLESCDSLVGFWVGFCIPEPVLSSIYWASRVLLEQLITRREWASE